MFALSCAKGATTLDFAYHVQTDLGHHTSVCKVNGRYVPQHYQLQNAEVVEIFTCDSTHDERFLEMLRGRVAVVQTKSAKQKLQSFLATLEDELRTKGTQNQQHKYPTTELGRSCHAQTNVPIPSNKTTAGPSCGD